MTLRHPITGRTVVVNRRGVYEAYRAAGFCPVEKEKQMNDPQSYADGVVGSLAGRAA